MSIDYRPLFIPVNRDEVADFKRQSRASAQPWARSNSVATTVSVVVFGLLALVAVALIATVIPFSLSHAFQGSGSTFIVFVLVAFVGVAGLAAYRYFSVASRRWEGLLRRTRFATANSLRYVPEVKNPAYPGMVFDLGSSRHSVDNYQSQASPQFDLGNYHYTTGSGKNKTSHAWGYLALKLERQLPHMVLDARGNNVLTRSSLPTTFRRDQRLSLEGDFDKYFTLYCPRQYERDALYVFTPDLMALLIDESSTFDVEIVDDWMFVYSITPFELDKAATVSRLFRIIETVGEKALRQTDRYADERIGDASVNIVAPQGRRLKTGTTAASLGIILVAGWVAFSFARAWL